MNCKDCAHAGKCEDYRASCPLPRIGSKEWKWKLDGTICCTDKAEYYLRLYPNHGPIIFNESGFRVSQAQRLDDAKRIAELLARRDWRRENRGKK